MSLTTRLHSAAARMVLRLPRHWVDRIASGRPTIGGRRMDPQLHLLMAMYKRAGRGGFETLGGVTAARQEYLRIPQILGADVAPAALTHDRWIDVADGRLKVRVHKPHAAEELPCIVYFHGGGFVIGNLETHDEIARRISRRCGAIVVQVDYRLAPEHPFPTAVTDCVAATQWVFDKADELGADVSRIALAGDSAGGILAAVVSQQVEGLRFQLLIYPGADASAKTRSKATFGQGFGLDMSTVDWFMDHYANGTPLGHPEISPLKSESLALCPPTHVVVAGFDVLHDEGLDFVDALQSAGVQTTCVVEQTLMHGFIHMTRVEACARAVDALCDTLVTALRE